MNKCIGKYYVKFYGSLGSKHYVKKNNNDYLYYLSYDE